MMGSTIIADANRFMKSLNTCQDDATECFATEEGIQISLVQEEKVPLSSILKGSQQIFICEQKHLQSDLHTLSSIAEEGSTCEDQVSNTPRDTGTRPLTVMKARELLSWYTLSQNPHMPHVLYAAIPPVWVCCDMSDTAGTAWLGAESICTDNKVNAIKLYSVCCKGATVENSSLITLDELKQEHQRRHHATTVTTKGCAQYSLLGATVVENSIIESNRSVIADFQWRNVEKVLETPPLSAHAALFIKVTVGDMKSSTYQTYKELEFLDILAEGLRTGETEWLDPPDPKSAVDLTRALIEELENIGNNIQGQAAKATESQKSRAEQSATRLNIFDSVILERGDLDFTEQLWVKMRRSVTSYQDVTDCLKMVIKAVRYGQIKPWIHRNSSNSLSKLILQSYQQQQQQQVDTISLTGLMPIQMLLEMGLDKMRKDYINYFIGMELTTLNYLSYYLNTEIDLQEQLIRVKKLHHLLEIMETCTTFLNLPYERLFHFTQSCLQYYKTSAYNEDHAFQMQVKPAQISCLCQKEKPISWGVELSSGQGCREVKTSSYFSDKPLVDHATFDSDGLFDRTVIDENKQVPYYSTMVTCSLVNF